MSISAVGSAPVTPMSSESVEGPGQEHGGDGDDAGAQASAQAAPNSVQAAPTLGTGTILDKTA